MNNENCKKLKLKIDGMTCSSCEVLIENAFKKIPGVERAYVHAASGKADVYCSEDPGLTQLQDSVSGHGYKVAYWEQEPVVATPIEGNSKEDYLQIGSIFFFLMTLYLVFKQSGILPSGVGVTENMSLGFAFVIGLVAAVSSCLAVVGGLLLSVAAKYNEAFPHLTGFQRFKPHLFFNIGRVVSYTVLGGLVGLFGSTLTLSPRVNGVLVILVSIVMISLGFRLLKLFPGLTRFQPKMPKFFAHRIYAMAEGNSKSTPFVLGGLTFFLPCGFTQALQLYVLTQGDWLTGALTMLMFSLGTLPGLLSLSAVSSFAKGGVQKLFLKFAGALVILLGAFNLNNGFALTGLNIDLVSAFQGDGNTSVQSEAVLPEIVDGKQVVEMEFEDYQYSPNKFTVKAGIPVEWRVDGSGAVGCAQVLVIPKLNVVEYLSPDEITVINFTPEEPGKLSFNCSMGMLIPGAFNVVE